MERVNLNMPSNLRFSGGYNFNRLEDPFQTMSQNHINGNLNHRLYESLISDVYIDYSGIKHSIYDESNMKAGLGLNYTKKIPTGTLNLSYRYFRNYFKMTGVSAPLKILNEEHIVSDAKIIMLNRPYVDLSTIVIKDQTGAIIYQENFDYILTLRNNYIEIQRVMGGQIFDNQSVLVDYTAIQPGSYGYEADNNSFSTSIILLKKLIEIYYRGSFQDYKNLASTDFLILNYYDQNIFGGRIDVGFAGAGVEFDTYNSNVIPYKRYRYFIDLNWSFKSKFIVSLNGNVLDYKLIDNDVNQLHANINGKISYLFSRKTRIDLDGGYLSQRGRNIDLDLLTSKLEISTSLRQLQFRGGIEMYKRSYLNSSFTFAGTFVELIRKF